MSLIWLVECLQNNFSKKDVKEYELVERQNKELLIRKLSGGVILRRKETQVWCQAAKDLY